MKSVFICPLCGETEEYQKITKDNDKFAENKVHCTCGKPFELEDSYPSLEALDLIRTSEELYNLCKNTDEKNIENVLELTQNKKEYLNKSEIIKYAKIYELIKSKYKDNIIKNYTIIDDEFEELLISKYKIEYDEISFLIAANRIFLKNRFRKPFIIIAASIIEILFNDFFQILIKEKLGSAGSSVFMKRYNHTSIKECIDISNAFMNKTLKEQMDNIKIGFFNKWDTLRNERNSIIHSNNKYVSKEKVDNVKKVIDESVLVFSILKSKIYKKTI